MAPQAARRLFRKGYPRLSRFRFPIKHRARLMRPNMPEAAVCVDSCTGCSMNPLEFLELELEGWERRLDEGELPSFGDLSRLAGTAKKIHKILERNSLVEGAGSGSSEAQR